MFLFEQHFWLMIFNLNLSDQMSDYPNFRLSPTLHQFRLINIAFFDLIYTIGIRIICTYQSCNLYCSITTLSKFQVPFNLRVTYELHGPAPIFLFKVHGCLDQPEKYKWFTSVYWMGFEVVCWLTESTKWLTTVNLR